MDDQGHDTRFSPDSDLGRAAAVADFDDADWAQYWQHVSDVAHEETLLAVFDHHLRQAVEHITDRHGFEYGLDVLVDRAWKLAKEMYPESAAALLERRERDRVQKKKPIPAKLRTQVFERDEYRCVDCQTHRDLTADHIHPESDGGPTTLDNLATRCRSCNSSKGTRIEVL